MIERTYPTSDEALPDALAFVEEVLEGLSCSQQLIIQMLICVEEMFINIAHYGYPNGSGSITLLLFPQNGAVTIQIEDEGIPFNPLEKPDPDITLSAENRAIGGLGIYMVKQVMDSVQYSYTNNKNIFIMKKVF